MYQILQKLNQERDNLKDFCEKIQKVTESLESVMNFDNISETLRKIEKLDEYNIQFIESLREIRNNLLVTQEYVQYRDNQPFRFDIYLDLLDAHLGIMNSHSRHHKTFSEGIKHWIGVTSTTKRIAKSTQKLWLDFFNDSINSIKQNIFIMKTVTGSLIEGLDDFIKTIQNNIN